MNRVSVLESNGFSGLGIQLKCVLFIRKTV